MTAKKPSKIDASDAATVDTWILDGSGRRRPATTYGNQLSAAETQKHARYVLFFSFLYGGGIGGVLAYGCCLLLGTYAAIGLLVGVTVAIRLAGLVTYVAEQKTGIAHAMCRGSASAFTAAEEEDASEASDLEEGLDGSELTTMSLPTVPEEVDHTRRLPSRRRKQPKTKKVLQVANQEEIAEYKRIRNYYSFIGLIPLNLLAALVAVLFGLNIVLGFAIGFFLGILYRSVVLLLVAYLLGHKFTWMHKKPRVVKSSNITAPTKQRSQKLPVAPPPSLSFVTATPAAAKLPKVPPAPTTLPESPTPTSAAPTTPPLASPPTLPPANGVYET